MSDTLQKIINRNAAKLSSKKQQMSTVTLSTPPKDGGFFEDLYVALQQGFDAGFSVNEAFDVYKKGANISDVELQAYIDAVANMDESKITNEQYMFQKAVKENGGGFFGGMKALFENPGYLPQLIVTSGATMLGSLIDSEEVAGFTALGAGIGAGTGATLTAVSGPGALFGAAGGASGEVLAQGIEAFLGRRDSFNPAAVGVEAAIGAIPGGKIAKGLSKAGKIGLGATKGAAIGGGSDVALQLAHDGDVDPKQAAIAAVLGGGLGGGG